MLSFLLTSRIDSREYTRSDSSAMAALRINHPTVDKDGKSIYAWSVKQSGADRYHAIFQRPSAAELPIHSPLFDLLDEGIGFWKIDVANGMIRHNQSWLEHLEYAGYKESMPVSTWINLLLPDDCVVMQSMLDNPAEDSFAFIYRIASGRSVVLKMETRGFVKQRDEDGRPRFLQGIHINRTGLLHNITGHDDDHVKTIATNLGYQVSITNRNLDVEETILEDVISTLSDYLITEFGREVGKIIEFPEETEMRCSTCLNDKSHTMALAVYCPDVNVPRQMLGHLLTPGFSTSRIHSVNSISLARINKRIHDLGGHLALSTSVAQGLEFSIGMPTAQSRLSTQDVLIIDDDETVGLYVKKVLDNAGYSSHVITSSVDALAHFSQNPYQYRLVITDQTMPNMTGDVLMVSMLEQRPDLPVILCTGFSDTMTSTTAMEIGARAFLEKPLNTEQLLQIVTREILPPARVKEFV